LTYYGTGLGACGITSQDTDAICAVSEVVFDAAATTSNPNQNPLCGRRIRIQRFDARVAANVSIDVTVVDRCVACQPDDLDLSPSAFAKLADQDLGRVKGTWAWLP
jgi:expansin (peptidoglycan-binding protein)